MLSSHSFKKQKHPNSVKRHYYPDIYTLLVSRDNVYGYLFDTFQWIVRTQELTKVKQTSHVPLSSCEFSQVIRFHRYQT